VVDHRCNFQFGQVSTTYLKIPAIVEVHEDGGFTAIVHHRNLGCQLQVGSPDLLRVPEEHEVAQAVAVLSHWVKGVGGLGHRLHIGLLQLQSELDNVIWGSSSPAFKGDVTQVGPDTGKQGSSGREERSERSQGSHFHLYDCLCPFSLLIGGNAQRLQDSWRDSNKSNKQSKDDHVAHHCLIGLLCLLVGVHLRGSWSSKANHDCTLLATSKLGLKNLNLNL